MTPLGQWYHLIVGEGSLGKGNESGHQPGPEPGRDVTHAVAADGLGWRNRYTFSFRAQ